MQTGSNKVIVEPGKQGNRLARWMLCASLGLGTLAHANTPMRLLLTLPRTDMVNVGASGIGAATLQGGGVGSLQLAGVSGTVTQAFLYWNGIETQQPALGLSGGNGSFDEPEIRFENTLITGTLVAANGQTDCWPAAGPTAATYRADVTQFVQARGNGAYSFSGLADGLESDPTDSDAHSANGISLIVYFDDGNPANDQRVEHYEGMQSNVDADWVFNFGLDYIGGAVDAILHVSDGQLALEPETLLSTRPGARAATPELTSFFSTVPNGTLKWAGLSTPTMGFPRNGHRLWDIQRLPLAQQFSRTGCRHHTRLAQKKINLTQGDCVSLQVAQIVSAVAPGLAMLSPYRHSFGDVVQLTESASQIFTFTNAWANDLVMSPILVSPATRYRVITEDCNGRTLTPGQTCSVTLACTPPAFGSGASLDGLLRVNWDDVGTSIDTRSQYANLQCESVPALPITAVAFSRLTFEQSQYDFGELLVGTSILSPPQIARNTGSLPITLGVSAFSNATGLNVAQNSCTQGLVLQPGASCLVQALLQTRATAGQQTGQLRVFYSGSNPAASFALVNISATAVASTASDPDSLLKNGFETLAGAVECL